VRLGQVIVFVADIAKMRAFYESAFELRAVEEADGWVRFDAGGTYFALHTLRGEPAAAEPPVPREDTYIKLTFHVGDVAAARERLAGLGARMREPKSWGGRTFCDGIDPEGNVIQIADG
jgi:catechol 2,3-dioxygenase-like lactoylglutathione lyase family enzyme